jgi:regulator of sigma D
MGNRGEIPVKSHASQPTRRAKTRELIDHMIAERESMLVLLWKVSGRDDALPHAPDAGLLKEFTNLLVDYMAAGHFGLYQRITDGTERRRRVLELGGDIYPRIAESTQLAVAFNDRYADRSGAHLDARLPDDIARLSEALADRIQLEDQLIEAMLAQRNAPAA